MTFNSKEKAQKYAAELKEEREREQADRDRRAAAEYQALLRWRQRRHVPAEGTGMMGGPSLRTRGGR